MKSGKLLATVGMLVWCAVALTAWAHGRAQRTASFTITAADDRFAISCSDLNSRFNGPGAVTESEERTIQKSEARLLRVTAESNGGIQVQGWDNDSYGVTLCKAVEEGSGAQSTLAQIHLSFQNGELGVVGPPAHRHWSAHLLIRSPKGASLELSSHNGPLGMRGVDGQIKIKSENGPVDVRTCSGELEISSRNGPLTLQDNSGKLDVHTQNGPVTVALSGDSWNGAGLEAHANNGPITLQIPSGYRSGVLLESEGHSPFECQAAVCSEGRKTWDDDHKRIEFGSGPTVVRVSTVNGPVSVN